jgi:hypothetical protein
VIPEQYASAVITLAASFTGQPCGECGLGLDYHIIHRDRRGHPVLSCPRKYGEHVIEPQIDLTSPSPEWNSVNVLTPGGMVSVAADQVDTQVRVPVVLTEISPNTPYKAHTAPGGDWVMETHRRPGDRLDVRLLKND